MKGFEAVKIKLGEMTGEISPDDYMRVGAELEQHLGYSTFLGILLGWKEDSEGNLSGDFSPYKFAPAYCHLLDKSGIEFDARDILSRLATGELVPDCLESIQNFFSQLHNPGEEIEEEKKPEATVLVAQTRHPQAAKSRQRKPKKKRRRKNS